ncbi:MAG: ABC transporter permease [Anaerolineae bacterium]
MTLVSRRLIGLPLSLLGVATAVFIIMRVLPGDPVEAMLVEAGASPALIDDWRRHYGLSEPLPTQYALYLRSLARGDLGRSLISGRAVTDLIAEQFPGTLALTTTSFLLSLVVGGSLGLLSAWHRGRWVDAVSRLLAVATVSLPTYWTGLLAILLFAAYLRWLPASGQGTWRHLVLPTLTLGLASAGVVARLVRASVLEVLGQPYVQVAQAKGLRGRVVLGRHVLRAAAAPMIAFLSVQVGFLLAGTAITETVFSRPGLGRLLVEAVLAQDYPLAQGCILLAAGTYTVINTGADLLTAWIDPRARD